MQKHGMLTIIASFLFSISSVNAETLSVDALTDGIYAFICKEIDDKNDVPLIFVNEGDKWSLSDFPDLSVSKIKNGFKFKSSGDKEGFGFLKKLNQAQWDFEYLDQNGFYETSCIVQDYFVDLLIKNISPKIIQNGGSIVKQLSDSRKQVVSLKKSLLLSDNKYQKIETKFDNVLKRLEVKREKESDLLKLLSDQSKLTDNLQYRVDSLIVQSSKLSNEITFLEKNQPTQLLERLKDLQVLLDETEDAESKTKIQLKMLGTNLNLALARVASEQRKLAVEQQKIAEFEAQEKLRLAEDRKDLNKFRSEFFEQLRAVMKGKEGVNIVGDRFVFSSEVLFSVGSAYLSSRGKLEISEVAYIISQISDAIPDGIDWILRVDGHTDRIPFSGFGNEYKDNWELSQARALSVVRYLIDDLDIPANRLAANGFGEFQPIDDRDTPEAYKTNRRIELKFTEK
jgi:flagellar motor protein MotB